MEASGRIDRQSPVPFYFQLAAMLEHEIAGGRWQAGAQIPSEPDLCTAFGVSRSVVRQALQRLEQEGFIVRRKGHGTFVAEAQPRSWLLQSADGFFQDEVDRRGRRVTSRILRLEVAPLPKWAADALNVPEGSSGVTMERLRWVDGQVALHVSDYLPERLADTVLGLKDDHSESLYERLRAARGARGRGRPQGRRGGVRRPEAGDAPRGRARRAAGLHRVGAVGQGPSALPLLPVVASDRPHPDRDGGRLDAAGGGRDPAVVAGQRAGLMR